MKISKPTIKKVLKAKQEIDDYIEKKGYNRLSPKEYIDIIYGEVN